MAKIWTPEQKQAINARDTAVIVAAAAGSGKTSVLVERLTEILSEDSEEKRIPADRIVVVTFTNDAAAEMKRRLVNVLAEALKKDPDNDWLFRQQSLIGAAKISTIHSFCFNLIRENIHKLDISYGFRILGNKEEDEIIALAAERVVEDFCDKREDDIRLLLDRFCKKDDGPIIQLLLEVYEYIISVPYPKDWLDENLKKYDTENPEIIELWTSRFCEVLKKQLDKLMAKVECAEKMYRVAYQPPAKPTAKNDKSKLMANEKLKFQSIRDAVLRAGDADEIKSALIPIAYETAGKTAGDIGDAFKKMREKYKKDYRTILSTYGIGKDELVRDIEDNRRIISVLVEMEKRLIDEIHKIKVRRNAIGFSDAEQLTVELLSQKNDGKIVKTPLAEELSEYYRLIMIDEYQDTNNLQSLIFRMLSDGGNADKNGRNMFVVGDVKQSIYRFRHANPAIFNEVFASADDYTADDNGNQTYDGENSRIRLNRNFRSSKDVVEFVNFIFDRIMTKKVGEIDYKNGEGLVYGADYNDGIERKTEIIEVSSKRGYSAPKAVAEKIQQMLNSGVTVRENGSSRPCRAEDFCILLRNRNKFDNYAEALKECSISVKSEERSGYLITREISVLINLLKIIDNPMQDIPLTSVLMSPMFLMTADDIAEIRAGKKRVSMYKCVLDAVNDTAGEKKSCINKLIYFKEIYDKLRCCAAVYSLEKLIRTIYDTTDFISSAQLFANGESAEQVTANLRLFTEYARNYDSGVGGGLSGFIRFMNKLVDLDKDLSRGTVISDTSGSVAVKTMHGSKGLEYPFVFICESDSNFGYLSFDSRKAYAISLQNGIGFKISDTKKMVKYPTIPYLYIKEENNFNSLSEEIRILYVALTRAKERLFITLDKSAIEKSRYSFETEMQRDGGIFPEMVAEARSMQDLITMALFRHKDCTALRDENTELTPEEGCRIDYHEFEAEEETAEEADSEVISENSDAQESVSAEVDKVLVEQLSKAFEIDCGSKFKGLPAKQTVTGIAKKETKTAHLRRPSFMTEKTALSAAERGTAAHAFMEFADFEAAARDIAAERDRLVANGFITKRQGDAIDLEKISRFFKSELYSRIANSKAVYKERQFMIALEELDGEIGEHYRGSDGMLQGVTDCIFEEEDGMVILDYKTDRVTVPQKLSEEYSEQLRIYSIAMSKLYQRSVKEAYIYSFHLGVTIKIDI